MSVISPEGSSGRSHSWQEDLRMRYYPDRVRVLFVGESPPAGGTFFYRGDSLLYCALREAFGNPDDFLAQFKQQGFFLEDLVPYPVNRMVKRRRMSERRAHIGDLSDRLRQYQPEKIVTVMKCIKPDVAEAIDRAGLSLPHHVVPFPRSESRSRFVGDIRQLELWRT